MTGWEEGLEKLKEEMTVAVGKAKIVAENKVSGPTHGAPYNCIRCTLGMWDCTGSVTCSASVKSILKMKSSTLQAAKPTNSVDRKAFAPGSPKVLVSVSHDKNDTAPAIDAHIWEDCRSSCVV